jgi:serine phosphatase RsbU (regulator of sigma subunit)
MMVRRSERLRRAREWARTPVGSVVIGVGGPLLLSVPVVLWLNASPFRPGFLYVAFVAVLAALGGLGCGVVAAVTSVAALWFVSFAPKYSIATRTADDVVSLVLVALSLAAVLVVVRRLDLARLRAARARRESDEGERRERLLLDVASALGSARDRDEVRAMLRNTIVPAASASSVAVLELGDGPGTYGMIAGYDDVVDAGGTYSVGERRTPARVSATTGSPVYLDEPDLGREFPEIARIATRLDEHARAAVPFELLGGRGAVTFGFSQRQAFPEELRRFLETIGLLVGSTLRRIDAVTRSEEHNLAVAFDAMLHGVGLYRAVRDEAGAVVDFEVRHLNRQATELRERLAPADGLAASDGSFPLAGDGGLFEALVEVVESGEPFLRDPWWSPVAGGEPVPFTVQVTKSGPDQVLLVMRDVHAREAQRREREASLVRTARDRALISRLEDALLPDELPALPGHRIRGLYRAAAHEPVGGDWYDAIHLPDGDLALTVGDVAGHGLDATATMVFARSAVRALLADGMAVDEALRRVDAIMASQGAFVTCWVATYSPARSAVTIASAGHPPALLGAAGSVCVLDTPVGPPLGVDAWRRPTATSVDLPDGGVLLAYTDGLVERRTRALDHGIARLVDALTIELDGSAAPDWLDRVVARAIGDDAVGDDLCVLALARGWDFRHPSPPLLGAHDDEGDDAGPGDGPGDAADQARSKLAAIVPPWRKRVRRFPFTS